jgi:ribosomal protein S18 acetylase RimI-like enzyme
MREHAGPHATARFQRVATHPAWRRRGLCTALIDAVSRFGFERWQAAEQIMVADPADVAIGIYRSLGFSEFEREWSFERWPPQQGEGVPRTPAGASGHAAPA